MHKDPIIPEDWQDQPDAYDAQGVDLTLIRQMLAMTYKERLLWHQDHIRSLNELSKATLIEGPG